MITIPDRATKKWSVSLESDVFGNIVRTRSLDFNKKGYISLAKKPICLYSDIDSSHFGHPVAMASDPNNLYVITDDYPYAFSGLSGAITGTPLSGGTLPTFTAQSDIIPYQGLMHASGDTDVSSLSGSNWTQRISGLSGSYPHPLCNSEHQQFILVGNGNVVKVYNSAYVLQTTLTLPSEYVVVWMRWQANMIYIGTKNIQGGDARLFLWNGTGTAAQSAYSVKADWIYSGCEYDSSIAVITSAGQLLRFNGGGFTEIDSLPVYYNPQLSWSSDAATSSLIGRVSSRGMEAKGRRIYINLDGSMLNSSGTTGFDDSLLYNQPSGLWVYDPDIGLYHKAGYGNKDAVTIAVSSLASNELTMASAATFETGDPVLAGDSVGLTGLQAKKVYYAIKTSSTKLKLALSQSDAFAGRNIVITGVVSANDKLTFETYKSVGATKIRSNGGIALINRLSPNIFNGSEVYFGGKTNNATADATEVLMSLGMGRNVGSLTTPKIHSSAVTDIFQKIFPRFPVINLATQKIIVKYKLTDRFGLPVTNAFNTVAKVGLAVWASTTTFTVDTRYYDFKSVQVGDEVEFINGSAAGFTAHITSIDTSATPSYTITIDEAPPDVSVSDKSDFMVDSYVKLYTIDLSTTPNDVALGFTDVAFTQVAKWLQLRFELRGWIDMEEISVENAPDQSFT